MNQRMRIHLLLIVFSCIINVVFSIWRSVPIPTTNVDWVSGTWVSSMVAFLVGKTTISGVILQSINGGSNWTESFSGTDPFYDINSVTISGKVYIVAVCSSGAIYYSSNTIANVANSYSWTKVSVTSGSLYGVALGITGNIVAVGFQSSQPGLSLVYKSSVSTLTSWTPAPPGLVVQLNGIGTADGNNFLIVGDVGTILYFQYSTSFFTPQTSPTTVQLYDISVLPNSNIAVACGASATVLTTSTLGAKWTSVNVAGVGLVASSTNFYYHPIAILNARDVYLASSTGDILISQNAGDKWTTAVSPALAYPLLTLAAYTINLVVVGSGRFSFTNPATSAVYVKGPG